jgi:cbb3-type cytochrome oxidase subunit 3
MNHVFRAAAQTVEYAWVMGAMTALFLVFFAGWTWWAFRPKNRARLEEAAQMPFMDGGDR